MNKCINIFVTFWLFISINNYVQGQKDTVQKYSNLTFKLKDDTLFVNKDFKIYKGMKLICGQGSGANGWYISISFKSGASWPVVLFRNTEIKNNIDYQYDEEIRNKDKVKDFLHSGITLTVKKIKNFSSKRYGDNYVIFLKQEQGVASVNYRCRIQEAIRLREILIPNK